MKVFISHHIRNDEKLASILLSSLKKRGISGYMAQRKQEYEILILDKIKNEIESSHYLVAIITKNSLGSASVHEEIGYALGNDIPVILMVEETIDERGVLIHGKEPEIFTRKYFEKHADIIIKHILEKGLPSKKRKKGIVAKKEKNQYQQYTPAQRVSKLKQDLIQSFNEHKFSTHTQKIKTKLSRAWDAPMETITIIVSENKKTRQRFFCLCYDEFKTEDSVKRINIIIGIIFKNLSLVPSWKNMCLILIHGNVVKTRISKYYSDIQRSHRTTNQNTLITFDPSIIYHGLGQGRSGFTLKRWNYPSSMPKFFAHGIKSKNDMIGRIGIIIDFIDEHDKIFKQIPKLRIYQKKFQVIPEIKAEVKRKKKAKEEEKRRAKRRARIYARPRRYTRYRGGYGGNPAYVGTPKE